MLILTEKSSENKVKTMVLSWKINEKYGKTHGFGTILTRNHAKVP
jgi:hypothetical protein